MNRSTGAVLPTIRSMLCLAALLRVALPARAQSISRGGYIRYVPLRYPRLERQSAETLELQLFGDAGSAEYADVSPRNGIDEKRQKKLF